MKTMGIIAAMATELAPILAAMQEIHTLEKAGCTYYSGRIGDVPVVAVEGGIGKVNAAMHTQVLIDIFQVDAIINTGIAGSLSPKAAHLSLVISENVYFYDIGDDSLLDGPPGKTRFAADQTLVELACRCAATVYRIGDVLSGDEFVISTARKMELAAAYDALCVEMEGGAVAQTADMNGIPFVVIRCISDMADDAAVEMFDAFELEAARLASDTVLAMLAQWQDT